METRLLKNGESLSIREAEISDAQLVLEHLHQVGDETDFLSFSTNQINRTLKGQEEMIAAHSNYDNQVFLLAYIENELVCVMNVWAIQKPRMKHIGEFGISVIKDHWYKGIGSVMIDYMINWAKQSKVITKLNLTVQINNAPAIKLYSKKGFVKEGQIKRGTFTKGEYYDMILMGLLID